MNDFCKDCQHCNIPRLIKDKFNIEVKNTFLDCPTSDKKVLYCFVKNYEIDWVKFVRFLIKSKRLNSDELELIEKEGKNELDKRGK